MARRLFGAASAYLVMLQRNVAKLARAGVFALSMKAQRYPPIGAPHHHHVGDKIYMSAS